MDESTAVVGDAPELEETRETVRTQSTITRTDTGTTTEPSRLMSSESLDHSTTYVSYSVVAGQGAEALRTHSTEKYTTHVETTKTIVTMNREYDNDGGYTETTETTTYRHTDNPATRNDIEAWKSTQSVVIEELDGEDGSREVAYKGSRWLTDQIETDPDFDRVPFVWSGGTKTVSISEGRYFGDDSSAFESANTEETTISHSAGFDSTEIKVSGSYTTRGSSISNVGGAAHSISGDKDGDINVRVGASSYTISAEEWDAWVKP